MSFYDSNIEWTKDLEIKYENCSETEVVEYYDKLYEKWQINDKNNILKEAIEKINITSFEDMDMGLLNDKTYTAVYEVSFIHGKIKQKFPDLYESSKPDFDKIYYIIYYFSRIIKDVYLLNRSIDKEFKAAFNEDPEKLTKFTRFWEESKRTPVQNLLLYFMELFPEEGFSQCNGNLYRPHYYKGYNTKAWKKVSSIKDYMYKVTNHNTNYTQWEWATSNISNISNCEKYFTEANTKELPIIVKNRYLFSFRNGIYHVKYNISPPNESPRYIAKFFPYVENEYLKLEGVASKFHDTEFNDFPEYTGNDWFKIIDHCPTFKSLLDYQELPIEVQKWLCIFMGRNCFNIEDLDKWQCLLYLLGQAGAGKSTILMKILHKWYDHEDTGIISNNIDKKFGIKPHANKFMVLAPEISENFQMEQTDWQLLVEGGHNTYAEKYKNDETINWKIHMTMGGNKMFKFKNNSGSVSRRAAVTKFTKKVIKTDTGVDSRLEEEMAKIIKLCVSGYHWAVNEYGKAGIWDILPNYFKETKEDMEINTNSLQNYLKSGKVTFGKGLYVPEKVFVQGWQEHCKENNLPRDQWTSEFYENMFVNNGIKITKEGTKEYPKSSGIILKRTKFFMGIDITIEGAEDNPE